MFPQIVSNSVLVAQGIKVSHNAMNVTKLADPTAASIILVKKIGVECLPPQFKYPLKCLIFALQCGVVFYSSPALIPFTDALTVVVKFRFLTPVDKKVLN